jgi:hypothetical protein
MVIESQLVKNIMKVLSSLLLCLTVLTFTATTVLGQTEKENVIAAARALESSPLEKETAKKAERALKWAIETDEVSLIVCGGTFSLFSDKKNKQSSLMTMAYTIGMAAYKIENPTKDENSVQLAGLETALKAYEMAVKEKPKTKSDQVDALLVKRSNGELPAIVSAADCGKK